MNPETKSNLIFRMSQVIIGIHGLGNKPSKKTLEKWWIDSIYEGLKNIGKPVNNLKFELVYWADLAYEKPLNENLTDKEDPYYLEEKYIPASTGLITEKSSLRKRILDFLQVRMDTIFLKEDYSLNYTYITNAIIHRYFKDLESYYSEEESDSNVSSALKKIARKRLADVLKKYAGDKIILIAHSMGSIIAFDVLTHVLPEIPIDTFITMGSPLGLPVVKSRIAAESDFKTKGRQCLCTPPGVEKNWFNFADLNDNVSINYCLSDDYFENSNGIKVTDYTVSNDYCINKKRNPHHIVGYLRTPEFAEILYTSISKKKKYFHQIIDFFNKLFWVIKIRYRKE